MAAINRTISIAVLLGMAAAAARGTDDFPYDAYVAVDGAEVVAGPGHRFYATDRLARGTKLEIYREEASGWLAIRPPEGSFNWVPARFVERSAEGQEVGRVKEPASAWIGTAVEHVSEHRQQVTLKAGELVQILDEKSVGGEKGKEQTWLKIAPPAGEFRWIHLRDVSRQPPEVVDRQDEAQGEDSRDDSNKRTLTPTLSQRERERHDEPRRFEVAGSAIALRDLEPGFTRRDPQLEPAQFRGASSAEGMNAASPDGFVPRKRRTSEQLQTASGPAYTVRTSTPSLARPRVESAPRAETLQSTGAAGPQSVAPATSGTAADEISRQLESIDVDLSLTLARDRSLWNLAALRERTQRLVEQGADPVARGQARLMLDKIKQFEEAFDVKDYAPVASGTGGQAAAGTPAVGDTKAASTALADPRYDAEGWLKPVVSRKSDKPIAPYAVVDREGQPLCFVTPSPGLNLQRYLNKQVGVYGRRGYVEELKKPHVTAERVIDLDRQWR